MYPSLRWVFGEVFSGKGPPPRPVIFIIITWNIIMHPRRTSWSRILTVLFILFLFSIVPLAILSYTKKLTLSDGNYDFMRDDGRHLRISGQHAYNFDSIINQDAAVTQWSFSQIDGDQHDRLPKPNCPADLLLLILVTSSPENGEIRNTIRNTWASIQGSPGHKYKTVFLIGETPDYNLNIAINREIQTYGDIVKGAYLDTYRNLTYKVLHGFHWASTSCLSQYYLKTDDDCFINTIYLPTFLASHNMKSDRLYVGNVFSEKQKRQVIRNRDNRWYVPKSHYAPDHYPKYASGTGYITSHDVLQEIIETSQTVPPFPNEDAYIGVLVDKINISPMHSYRFTFHNTKWSMCNFRYLFQVHQVNSTQLMEMFNMMKKSQTMCGGEEMITSWN